MGKGLTTVKKEKAPKKEKSPTKRELCVKYHAQGMTNEAIAEKAETTKNSVAWYLSKEGLKSNRATKPKKEKKKTE